MKVTKCVWQYHDKKDVLDPVFDYFRYCANEGIRIGIENFYIKVQTTKTTHTKSGILFNKLKDVGKIEEYEKKINLNSDKKRFWLSELKSLNDGTFCDSVSMPIDLVGKLVSKEEVEFYDDEKYEPESDL